MAATHMDNSGMAIMVFFIKKTRALVDEKIPNMV
jgi:hypothetical protein